METTSSFDMPIVNLESLAKGPKRGLSDTTDVTVVVQPKKRNRRAGKLARIMEIPMDVLFEIFGHLQPLDVLHLARCTKDLRRVLMHRSSSSVWRSARENVPGLPGCLYLLDEPQYANLAFENHCHICLAPNVRSVEWIFRVRICGKCAKIHLYEQSCSSPFYEHPVHGSVPYRPLVPSRPAKKPEREVIFLDALLKCLDSLTLLDGEARVNFINARKRDIKIYQAEATLCQHWHDGLAKDRAQELDDMRLSRKNAIIDKLTALGWRDEIDLLLEEDALDNHRFVKQPALLTERTWANISGVMKYYMKQMRDKRLARERRALIFKRKRIAIDVLGSYKMSQLPFTLPMPESADFCAFEPVVQVLELPSDVDVTAESFEGVYYSLPALFGMWRATVLVALSEKVKEASWDEESASMVELTDDEAVRKLTLATTVFTCRSCSHFRSDILEVDNDDDDFDAETALLDTSLSAQKCRPLFFPHVAGHRCLTLGEPTGDTREYRHDPSNYLSKWFEWRRRWCAHSLVISEKLGKSMERIVKACGLDTGKATAQEMDKRDDRLACLSCVLGVDDATGRHNVLVFGWREALRHAADEHRCKSTDWYLLSGEEGKVAREKEVLARMEIMNDTDPLDPPYDEVVWSCAHCRDLPQEQRIMAIGEVKLHVIHHHQVESPAFNVDYFKDYAAPQIYATDTPCKTSMCSIKLPKFKGKAKA